MYDQTPGSRRPERIDRVAPCDDQRVDRGERELRKVALAEAEAGGQGLAGERGRGGTVMTGISPLLLFRG